MGCSLEGAPWPEQRVTWARCLCLLTALGHPCPCRSFLVGKWGSRAGWSQRDCDCSPRLSAGHCRQPTAPVSSRLRGSGDEFLLPWRWQPELFLEQRVVGSFLLEESGDRRLREGKSRTQRGPILHPPGHRGRSDPGPGAAHLPSPRDQQASALRSHSERYAAPVTSSVGDRWPFPVTSVPGCAQQGAGSQAPET